VSPVGTKSPRAALIGFLAAMVTIHATIAAWTPVQGDAWNAWIWHARHAYERPGAWLGAFVASHYTFSDLAEYLVARSDAFYVIVAPLAGAALVVGVFALAMRRLPRAAWDDVLGVALVSALVWIAQPRAGVAWFYRPSVALYVCGAALAVWLVAPLRCGWRVPRWAVPLLAVAGYCTGTSTRAIATAALIGVALAVRKAPRRERWMWAALAGLVVGTAVGYLHAPYLEVGRVLRRGFEPNLIVLRLPVEQVSCIVSLVAALALAHAWLGGSSERERPDTGDALRWCGAWVGTSIWCLFGPRYYEATLFPTTAMLAIAALPFALWYAQARALRRTLVGFAVAVHAVAWPAALVTAHRFGAEGAARLALLEDASPGQRVAVPPYSQILSTAWFFGEDFAAVRERALVASEVFGLRDIAIEPTFRRLEASPNLSFVLAVDGVSDADLRAARPPALWSDDIADAREQFAQLVRRLHAVTHAPVQARLLVANLAIPERGERPLVAAWSDADGLVSPRVGRSPIDENNEITTRIYPPDINRFDEAWIVHDGTTTRTPYRNGSPRLRPATPTLHAMVVCNAERCLVADAFVAQF